MSEENGRLEQLKKKMTPTQRQQMADLLSAELERRKNTKPEGKLMVKSAVKSSGLSGLSEPSALKDFYSDVGKSLQAIRAKKQAHGREVPQRTFEENDFTLGQRSLEALASSVRIPSTLPRAAMLYGLVGCGLAKILFTTGLVNAAMNIPMHSSIGNASAPSPDVASTASVAATTAPASEEFRPGNWTPAEKKILTSLDQRRVELEQRSEGLDRREDELKLQAESLGEKLAELRSLTGKLEEARSQRDKQAEARIEQLASVYGSMAPNEAAPLIARLDESTSLSLLQHMPGKRMGQILSAMDRDRAVELTKSLSTSGEPIKGNE